MQTEWFVESDIFPLQNVALPFIFFKAYSIQKEKLRNCRFFNELFASH